MPHNHLIRRIFRAGLLVLPVLAGAGLAASLIAQQEGPNRREAGDVAKSVIVIGAPSVGYVPRATGFGEARPARVWRAVPQVAGEIIASHDGLAAGTILSEGALLFHIDPTTFEIAVREVEAAIAARKADLRELRFRRQNTERSLEIERKRIELARAELKRQRSLLSRGTTPQAAVDRQEREFLQQRRAVQELKNILARLPAERERLQAELEREGARLARAQRDLTHTKLKAPFDLRVGEVLAERGQVVQAGETLMHGDDVAASEVEAEVPIARFRALLDPSRLPDIAAVEEINQAIDAMGLRAEVRLRGADTKARWSARLDRLSEAIDPETRTVGVVVVVERPYAEARPPERPPLVKGMYVEVQLCGPVREPKVVVPRAALHQGRVYLSGADDRLEIREVTIASHQGGVAVIKDGLGPGERVVLTDLVPAIGGMRLAPRTDDDAAAALTAEARGEGICP